MASWRGIEAAAWQSIVMKCVWRLETKKPAGEKSKRNEMKKWHHHNHQHEHVAQMKKMKANVACHLYQ
jgi:hypothetical protein